MLRLHSTCTCKHHPKWNNSIYSTVHVLLALTVYTHSTVTIRSQNYTTHYHCPPPPTLPTYTCIPYTITPHRLCLLGDLERHVCEETSLTVSRYDTTGSDFLRGIQAWSSSRSFRQISKWSSPAPGLKQISIIQYVTHASRCYVQMHTYYMHWAMSSIFVL